MKTDKVNELGNRQYWFFNGETIVFQSYDTIVCKIDNWQDGNKPIVNITEGQPQSKTTAKYLNKFLSLHIGVDNYKNL